jgi:hypothetical protein
MTAPPVAEARPVRVFISHASADREIAIGIAKGLRDAGLEPWLAIDAIQTGENYAEEIFASLVASDAVVIVLSRDAVASPHVKREMNLAIDRRKRILPFSLEVALTSGNELSADWKYWLGVVQVEPFVRVADTVRLIAERTRLTPVAVPTRLRGVQPKPDLAQLMRMALIQVASDQQNFAALVARLRHLRRSRKEFEEQVRAFRDRGLIVFDEPLEDSTLLRLST